MTMHFQSMKDLVGDFDSIAAAGDNYVPGTNPSFLELILHPEGGNRGKTGAEEYDPRYYRVLANVGWAIDEGVRTHLEDAKLIKILKNMNLEMYLNLIQHEVKNQGGRIVRRDGGVCWCNGSRSGIEGGRYSFSRRRQRRCYGECRLRGHWC